MVEELNESRLSEILKATSDVTRRALLTQLVQQGATRVTDLASYYDMTLNAISKHIKVLEKAGLVTRTEVGRTHWIKANLEPVNQIDRWFSKLKSIWELRINKLETILNTEEQEHD